MKSSLTSMTGYGSDTGETQGWRVRVECRSVNHRRLSTRVYTPEELRWLEPRVIQSLREVMERGSVEVRVEVQPGGDSGATTFDLIDEGRFQAVTQKLNQLAINEGLMTPISLEAVWEFRDFFERNTTKSLSEESAGEILPIFESALAKLLASRRAEGKGIADDLRGYLQHLDSSLDKVEELRQRGREQVCSRLETRLREAMAEFEVGEIDEARLTQELATYVERGDIAEELQRARSHVATLHQILSGPEAGVGKKIDFYLQELIRETNTMGSKSQHAGLTDEVIEMKSVIEKMREQAANIE